LIVVALAACSDDDTPGPYDKGVPDAMIADVMVDGPVPDQAQLPDQLQPDQVVPDVTPVTDANTACKHFMDLAPLTLHPDYCLTHKFVIPKGLNAVALKDGGDVYTFSASSPPLQGVVKMGTINASTGYPGSYATVFSFTVSSAQTLTTGSYVAVSPAGFAAVGYTEDSTASGAVFWGDKGIKTPKKVDNATANFDVVFLDDKTMLINGAGVDTVQGGQGVYLYEEGKTPRKLIKDMGPAGGHLALSGQVLYASGTFAAGINKVYGFSLAEIKTAISGNNVLAPIDGDEVFAGKLGDIGTLDDHLAVIKLDGNALYQAVGLVPVTVLGSKVTKGTPLDLVSGTGSSITRLTGSGNQLGMVLKGKPDLAIVIKK
jgi:hypothetical protein